MVHIPGRQVLRVTLLKDSPKEVQGLIERIDRDLWVELGPKCIEDLVPGGTDISGLVIEKAEERSGTFLRMVVPDI